jgi:hypothetical protein
MLWRVLLDIACYLLLSWAKHVVPGGAPLLQAAQFQLADGCRVRS